MKNTDFDRNHLLRRALQPGTACPPLAELLDAHFTGAADPRAEALRLHAAECPACGGELALAGAFDATPKSPAEAEEIAWVAAQLRGPAAGSLAAEVAPPPQLARVLPMAPHAAKRARLARQSAGTPLWSRWAAAALLVVGLGIAFEWGHRSFAPALPDRPDVYSPDVVRSGEVRLLAPAGVLDVAGVDALPPFSWRPVAGAVSYRVELRDVADELLWQGISTGTTLAAPPELLAQLATLVTYRWNVTAFDAAQSDIGHSPAASFRVEPPAS